MSPPSTRSSSVARHLRLAADLISGKELDRRSLAERLGVQPAMADRLLNAAVALLPGVTEHREGKVRKVRMARPAQPTPPPSYATALAACFGASLWPLFEGSVYRDGIRDAAREIIGRTRRSTAFKEIDRKFWFLRRGGEVALLDRAPLLDEVLEAVLRHRVLSLEYTRFSGKEERLRVHPLSVVVHDHQLYVVGRGDDGRLHPYRFARISAAEALDETFVYPSRAEYNPEQVFRDSFGIFLNLPARDVELRLDSRWAAYARAHRWHDSQVVEVMKDHVRVRFHLRLCPELEAWVLGFGEQAEVVAPPELRERIQERALALARVYERKKKPVSR
jgi:predicted DNA-binding transcriptional regulator YafY